MKVKIMTLLLIVLSLAVFTACSKGNDPDKTQKDDGTVADKQTDLKNDPKGNDGNKSGDSGLDETDSNNQGKGETGNDISENGQSGNGQSGNGQSGNGQSGNGQSGNSQSGNGQSGNGTSVNNGIATQPVDLFSDKKIFDVTPEEYVNRIEALKEYKLDLGKGFEGFDKEVNEMYDIAVDFMKIGAPIPSIYGFTFAQGSVTSFRYAVGLMLKGKGVNVQEEGLLCDWDEIYGLSLTTPIPYFMEALSIEKSDAEQAKLLKEYGSENPISETMIPDTEMIKGLGTDELKQIYDKLTEYEKKLYEVCVYVPQKGERTKTGFSSEYHTLITMWYAEHEDMAGAAEAVEKVVLTAPFSPENYVYAAYVNLGAGDVERAAYYINNGLLIDDRNGDVNLFASLISYGIEDNEKAKEYLTKAKSTGVSEQYKDVLKSLEKSLG